MPVVGSSAYPTIEDVLNLARVHLNDASLSGAGRIFTDSNPAVLPLLNDALADLQRGLQNQGVTTNLKEYFTPLTTPVTPVNSSLGVAVPNPGVQQCLSYTGFFDGLLNAANPSLPIDCLVVTQLWNRQSGTQLTYTEIDQAESALESRYQGFNLGEWEWRGDSLWWNGSLVSMDIRIRYIGAITFYGSSTPVSSFPTTTLPFRDCVTALAYLVAEKFAASRVPSGATNDLIVKAQKAIDDMANRYIRRGQSVVVERSAYGYDGDLFNW